MMMDFDIQVLHSVKESERATWEKLGHGMPFSSYTWYHFGETVMRDCEPVYILLLNDKELVARATFWVIRNEPLPISWKPLRQIIQGVIRHRPLFVCRSPLANTSGLILPEGALRQPALDQIIEAAKLEAKKSSASFLMFDYMKEDDCNINRWPGYFSVFSFSDSGTKMKIFWPDFNQYLADLKPKVRKHYRQYQREAEVSGIRIIQQNTVTDINAALDLIRNVEQRHHSAPNPWVKNLLKNANQLDAVWLTARQGDRLIGCELILVDNGTQMVTALGMAKEFPHVYFLLGYADIRLAIEGKREFIAWGSGAFETKKRLGFELEHDNRVVFAGITPLFRAISGLAAYIGT